MGRNTCDKLNWKKQTNQTVTAIGKPGYTATITWTGTDYSLTITGAGAPAVAYYTTRKKAKHAYQEFLHTVS